LLLSEAEYVLTDSFHCTVFSILFHKKFLTFYRLYPSDKKSSHSRIESLLEIMKLKERALKTGMNDDNALRILCSEPNWETVDQNVSELRTESMKFLKDSLEIQKKN